MTASLRPKGGMFHSSLQSANISRRELQKGLIKQYDIIHVTPQGVAIPSISKYKIPRHYVENTNRLGSYGEYVNGKFVEKLRIDPATLPGMKGPNYSHYHLNGKHTHYGPHPQTIDPGFNP
jgi:hypothetical protein